MRLTGVCHSNETLFVIDKTVKPGDPILLEAGESQSLVDLLAVGKGVSVRPGDSEMTSITVEPVDCGE